MQKRNPLLRAFSFTQNTSSGRMQSNSYHSQLLNPSKAGDRAALAIYIDNVLLPKHITDSFYATWLHCYEELFEASLSLKSSSFRFDWTSTWPRKETDKLNFEKAEIRATTIDVKMKGKYVPLEPVNSNIDQSTCSGTETFQDEDGLVKNFQQNSLKASHATTKLFAGKKKIYKVKENDDL